MSKQTAVEWLIEQVNSDEYQKAFGQTYISILILEQAKAMEKEQIVNAYNATNAGYERADDYYQETYRSGNNL